tara:strand:+ start:2666 stop:3175 length:510 start_codon:yes stop_codon:yes gene_type:complete
MMKKIFAITAFASALGLVTPAAAEIGRLVPAIDVNTGAQVQLAGGYGHGGHGGGHNNYRGGGHNNYRGGGHNNYRGGGYSNGHRNYGGGHYDSSPARHGGSAYRGNVRSWGHWRPYVERRQYHSFGAPTYYRHHPRYGDYYRVRARDRHNVAVWLGISAVTGAILFSNY